MNLNYQDKEETCHRTCFSLQLDGQTLDAFSELKSVSGLKEGSVIKLVDEPYTVRQVRLHVRHVNDLMHSIDPADNYNAINCNSLTYVNELSGLADSNNNNNDMVKPFDFVLPGSASLPLLPLHTVISSNSNLSTNSTSSANENSNKTNASNASKSKGSSAAASASALSVAGNSSANSLSTTATNCLKQLTFSGWNPPNGKRKMHGDLLYLHVITNEDKRFHITASTRGFYVNQ